ncbi:purine-binding chemotaxis protein CheW [Azospirillum agricola]|uniref:chemotaxis protein CheW n=1 Tax=Azospirillum agricola TaxID=1720247 RepID=UPI001AE854E2|nr:chemotaxis protein CheW [Azospirillum agricola]MBP2231478.1 purine-binding chemotaxis protein CheW [Azospirillum agricola]
MADDTPTAGSSIDWGLVRDSVARRNAAMDEAFAGHGPWADAVLRRRAEALAERPETGDDRPLVPLLLARGAATLYGLDLRHLAHIVPMPRLAPVPGGAPAMLGVIAVGGRVMRLFDLDRLCGGAALPLPGGERGEAGYAIVLRTGSGRPAALRVAAVERVADIDPPRAAAPPEAGGFVRSITADRTAVLDMTALLDFVKA